MPAGKNKTNMKLEESNTNFKMHQWFSKQQILGFRVTIVQQEISVDIDTNLLLNNVYTMLVKIMI